MINKVKNTQIMPDNKQNNIFILTKIDHPHPMVSIVFAWSKLVTHGRLITFPKELGYHAVSSKR